jgi:hypothetical protein
LDADAATLSHRVLQRYPAREPDGDILPRFPPRATTKGLTVSPAKATLHEPSEQSDDELYDILIHIDREAYPARYQAVRDEYVRRHGDRVNGQPVDGYFDDARRERPFAERRRWKRRVLVALAIWSLIMLAIRAVQFLSSGH